MYLKNTVTLKNFAVPLPVEVLVDQTMFTQTSIEIFYKTQQGVDSYKVSLSENNTLVTEKNFR